MGNKTLIYKQKVIDNLNESNKIGISSGLTAKPILKGDKLIILTNNSTLYVLKIK
jgi:hypothetical protein